MSENQTDPPRNRRTLAAAGAILLPAACAVLVGLPAIDGAFVRDDWPYVSLNPLVAGDAPWATVFASGFQPDMNLGLYRPVTVWSYQGNWRQAGGAPRVWHVTNLALAAAAASLLAWLFLVLGASPLWAGLGALLYAVHPARSESVLWIAGRSEILMATFSLLALVSAVAIRRAWRWPLCALAAVLAAYSKEQGFVLALLVPLLPGLDRRERTTAFIVLASVLGAAFVWRAHVLGAIGPKDALQVFPLATPWQLAGFGLYHLAQYARLCVAPFPLITEYDDARWPVAAPWLILGAATLALGPVLAALRRPRAAFAVVLFVLPLTPVLNALYRTGEGFAERFLCLPLAGFAMLVAFSCGALPARFRGVAAAVVLAASLVLAAAFYDRARDWTSLDALYDAQMRDAPELAASHHLAAGLILDEYGLADPGPEDLARARAHVLRALEIAPERAQAAMTLARALLREGMRLPESDPARAVHLAEAERLLRAALAAAPGIEDVRGALGLTLIALGRRDEAEVMLREAVRLHAHEFRAAINLAELLDETGRPGEARAVRERALDGVLQYAAANPAQSAPLRIAAQLAHGLGDGTRAIKLMNDAIAREKDELRRATAITESAQLHAALGRPADGRRILLEAREQMLGEGAVTPTRALALAMIDLALGEPAVARQRLEAVESQARGLMAKRVQAALRGLR